MNRRAFIALAAAPLIHVGWDIGAAETHVTLTIPPVPKLDVARLLRCIAEVETGNDDTRIGHRGERSRYQIRDMVWIDRLTELLAPGIMVGHGSFRQYCSGDNATKIAEHHIAWLRKNLPSDSPYWLYFAWQAGLGRARCAMTSMNNLWMFHAPAQRLANLYYDKSYAPTDL